jgi:tetratricopeptide (TPR) repeat protein
MLRWLLCGFGILFSGAAIAFAPPNPVGEELATLPPYCKEKTQQRPDPIVDKIWSDKFGAENWRHMHHYCYGLNYLVNRYYRAPDPEDRKWMLGEAVSNISYTINAAAPGFFLQPEMHYNRGKALRMLGRAPEAERDWLEAIRLDPTYVAAYIAIADYYAELKQQHKALETVSEGLRYVPASNVLQRRYQELGGKLPYPAAYEKPAGQSTADEVKAAMTNTATGNTTPDTRETEMPKPAETKPAIGMPGNPFCRFCPDTDESKSDSPQPKP